MSWPTAADGTLLDELLPAFDHRTMRGRATSASLDEAARAIRATTVGETTVAQALMAVRTFGRSRERDDQPWAETSDADEDFIALGEREHEIALGFVGRPWPGGGPGEPMADVAAFVAYQPRDDVKVGMSLRAVPARYGTLLVAETRIRVGPAARRPFEAYWKVVRIGSGLVRSSLLRAIARRAENQ